MLIIAWRNAIRHQRFTILNILGLCIGITTCLSIGLYVHGELTYDHFHQHADRLFRINQSNMWNDWEGEMSGTGPNVAVALRTDIPEFDQVTRLLNPGEFVAAYQTSNGEIVSILQDNVLVGEENFFHVFSFEMIQGDPTTALKGPNKVVITEETARKYFKMDNPVGKILQIKGNVLESSDKIDVKWVPFIVSGVIADPPSNSHIQFDLITSMSSYPEIKQMESFWTWTAFVNYGLVKEGVDPDALDQKIQTIPPKWAKSTLERVFGQTYDEFEASGNAWSLYLQPIKDVYLGSQGSGNNLGPIGNAGSLRLFSTLGVFILILSCINFMNLSTARAATRAKEVGIRKVLGSGKGMLISQFTFESVLFVGIGTMLAIFITEISIGAFSDLAGKTIDFQQQLENPVFWLVVLVFVIVLGLLSGSYPSFYLASFQPVDVIKNKLTTGYGGERIRNALVVFQFVISIALIIGTIFVQRQLHYISAFDLGYDNEGILQVHNVEQLDVEMDVVKNVFANNPNFATVGESHEVPPNFRRGDLIQKLGSEDISVKRMKCDASYIDLLGLKFAAGRNFNPARLTDRHNGVILNASAVNALGWSLSDISIGKTIYRSGVEMNVIGVVDDFHYNNLRIEIQPLVIYHLDNPYLPDSGTNPSFLSLRLGKNVMNSPVRIQSAIAEVREHLNKLDSTFPFEFSFLDSAFESSLRAEIKAGYLLNIFTVLAIFIACIGLYGLTAYSAEQRTKELGIRKILGANVRELIFLFTRDFTKLIVISIFISVPMAFYFVQDWLSGFAYRTPIAIWVFILAGSIAIVISWSTVAILSFKAASVNPVNIIRNE